MTRTDEEINQLAEGECTYEESSREPYIDGFFDGYSSGAKEKHVYFKKKREGDIWGWFKQLVLEFRRLNEDLMRAQGGANQIMVSIDMVAYDIEDWIHLNPHSINLKTGKTKTSIAYGTHREIDVKHLLFNQRIKSPVGATA